MRSLNFSYPDLPTAVDELGADAELLALTHPDLSLVRIRMMVEVLATHLEGKTRHVPERDGPSLYSRLIDCKAAFPDGFAPQMFGSNPRWSRVPLNELNEGAHHPTTRRRDRNAYAARAVKYLSAMSELWAGVAGVEPARPLRLPPADEKWRHQAWEVHIALDRAERLADQLRDSASARTVLDRVSVDAMKRFGAPQEEVDLVWLRVQSIELAMANHDGLPAVLGEPSEAMTRLVRWDDNRGREQLHRLAARQAVGLSNGLRIDEAMAAIDAHIEWREYAHEGAMDTIGEQPMYDYERGALLGTAGQLTAMKAHAQRSVAQLDEALAQFETAKAYFAVESDRYRQETYRLHALVEIVRLGGELTPERAREIDEALAQLDPSSLTDPERFNEKFRLAWGLKAAHVCGCDVPARVTLAALNWGASLDPETVLWHPDAAIAGWACLLFDNAPKALRLALERTGRQNPTLVGWLARVFVAEQSGVACPPPPEAQLQWWTDNAMAERFGAGKVAVLPFNFA